MSAPHLNVVMHIIVFASPPPRLLSLASKGPAIFQLCSVATHALTFRGLRSFADLHLRVSGKLLSDYNNGLLINRPLFIYLFLPNVAVFVSALKNS